MGTGQQDGCASGNGRSYAAKAERLDEERRCIEDAERERDDLWQWMDQLERLAEAGLHARGLAHDMGNALTSLMASSELALMQDDPAEHREALVQGLETARIAARRLQTFMQYTRRGEDEVHPISVVDVARDAERFLAYPIRKGAVTVEHRSDGEDRVTCSQAHLLQVLSNAMLSLIRGADPKGATISVDARATDGQVRVDVRRNAPRPTDEPPSAGTPARHQGTTGLELALSRRILQRNGGRIEVFGGAEDPVCFRILLPSASAPPAEDPSPAEPEETSRSDRSSRRSPASAWSPRSHGSAARRAAASKNGSDA